MGGHIADNSWVQLNIGGTVFETSRQTLCRDPESFLARLVSEDSQVPSRKDKKGAYVIDRDPGNFAVILHYLRTGFLKVPGGVAIDQLVEEAEFCNLPALVKLIKDIGIKKSCIEYFIVVRYPEPGCWRNPVQLAMTESAQDCSSILSEIRSKGLANSVNPGYTWAVIHAKLWPVLFANGFKLEKEEPNSWTFVRTVEK